MSKTRLIQICLALLLVGLGLIAGYYIFSKKTDFGIPNTVFKQANFTVFSVDPSSNNWKIQSSLSGYDSAQNVLTLHFINSNNSITLNQQTTPSPFNDISNYSTTFLSKLHEYAEVQTKLGTVALTHPAELAGKQSAIINTQGTLMFAQPKKDLNLKEWESFFQSLSIVR